MSIPVSCIFARASEDSHRQIIIHGNDLRVISSLIPGIMLRMLQWWSDGIAFNRLLSHVSEICWEIQQAITEIGLLGKTTIKTIKFANTRLKSEIRRVLRTGGFLFLDSDNSPLLPFFKKTTTLVQKNYPCSKKLLPLFQKKTTTLVQKKITTLVKKNCYPC